MENTTERCLIMKSDCEVFTSNIVCWNAGQLLRMGIHCESAGLNSLCRAISAISQVKCFSSMHMAHLGTINYTRAVYNIHNQVAS